MGKQHSKKLKNKSYKVCTVLGIILIVLTFPILLANLILIANFYLYPNCIPDIAGYKPLIVSSDSMETRIMTNDLAVIHNIDLDTLQEGHIIAYQLDDVIILHRIVDIIVVEGERVFITKGDHNNLNDSMFVKPEQIEGVFVFRIPSVGFLIEFLQTSYGILLLIGIPLLLFILYNVFHSGFLNKQNHTD
ncbi:MAG: signal peptidase I [Eubacterium sp.]